MSKFKFSAISSACLVFMSFASLKAQEDIEDFEFSVTTIDGREITQEDFKNKVLLVDFWGTWCPPCRKAIPHLVRLYEKYKDQGLEILGLNYERGANGLAKVKDYAKKNGITYSLAMGTDAIKRQVPNFAGYPTMLFFKRGLVFDQTEVGFTNAKAKDIEDWIKGALADKSMPKAKKGTDAADEEEPSEEKMFLESMDGKQKLEIGDGEHFRLLVLVHPRRQPTARDTKAIMALGRKHKNRLLVNFVTRGDLPGKVKGAIAMEPKGLARLRLGKAWPSYVLVSPSGSSKRTTGLGAGVWSKFAELIGERITAFEKALAQSEAEKKAGAKNGKKVEKKTEKTPAKKAEKMPGKRKF